MLIIAATDIHEKDGSIYETEKDLISILGDLFVRDEDFPETDEEFMEYCKQRNGEDGAYVVIYDLESHEQVFG